MTILKQPEAVSVRLDADQLAALRKIAEREKRSLAAMVRIAVASYLANYGKERKAR